MVQRIVRLREVTLLSGMSRSTIYVRMAQRLFPSALTLGPRMIGWPESEIAGMNAARIRGDSERAVRDLVATLEAARERAA